MELKPAHDLNFSAYRDKPAFRTCECCGLDFVPGLLIPLIAVSGLHLCFCMLPNILAKRSTDVIALLECPVVIPANETLVRSGVYQFAFIFSFLVWHLCTST